MSLAPDPSVIGNAATPPFLRPPDPATLFGRRAARFRALAPGNALEGFLHLMGNLADAQRQAVAAVPAEMSQPIAGLPPIGRTLWRRGEGWRTALDAILDRFDATGAPAATTQALAQMRVASTEAREALADQVLAEDGAADAEAWFVTAALQVYWTVLASRIATATPAEPPGLCPCCTSAPVAGVVRDGVRFLACGLCAAEWHLVRITCAHCQSTKGIAHEAIEGHLEHIKAETCEACGTYTKLLLTEHEPALDPLADDLASLGLDLLLDEAGWRRAHPNPFLLAEER